MAKPKTTRRAGNRSKIRSSSTAKLDIVGSLKIGIAQHQSGKLDNAERQYQKILAANPQHPDALHLLGLIEHQRGNHERAVELIKMAIRNNRNCSYYYNNLGAALKSMGAIEDATECYQKAFHLQPDYTEAAYNLGSIFLLREKVADAIRWYEKAIQLKPDYVDALSNLAAAYNVIKRTDDAIECCKKVLLIDSNNAVALNNLGNAMMGKKQPDRAIDYYQKSISADRANPEAHSNLGNALHDLGEQEKALSSYREAIELNPMYGEAYNNMGIVLREMGNLEEASRCYRKAMQLRPEDAEGYHNFGNVLKDQGQLEQAVRMYRRAIEYNSMSVDSHVNLGIALEEMGRAEEAIRSYSDALNIDSNSAKAYSHLVHQLQNLCAWDQIEQVNEKLDELTARAIENSVKPDEMPFLNLTRHTDACLNFKVAKAWSYEISAQVSCFQHFYTDLACETRFAKPIENQIVIGYLSNNFKNHPTAHLVQGMFKLHDRKRFRIHCYSYGEDDKSKYRERIKATCDRFIDIRMLSHAAAAKLIYADGVDILVDLVGYMKANRLAIAAMRPAPIQARWLGMAGTTGADFFDYLVTDALVSPSSQASFYSESLVHMPDCYQINDNSQLIVEGGITRHEAGLPEKEFVFCSFSSRYKYDPNMFRSWMRILKQVNDSVLWLLGGDTIAEKNLRIFAESLGIDSQRLIFARKINRELHLQRLQLADLALDTRIVNGAITTSEALWAGVPLVTLQGKHFASRMSSSLLSAAGLKSLVTYKLDQYEALAVGLARDPDRMNNFRQHLKENRLKMPLFDTSRFICNLEKAYLRMVEIYCAGEKPQPIKVINL